MRFQALDLHVHTPASKDFLDPDVTADAIVARAVEAGLNGIAITDHNSGEWIDRMKEAAQRTSLAIYPGVEISCTGGKAGTHVIALFDRSSGRVDIESLLGALGLTASQYGDLTALVRKDLSEVARIVVDRGGLVVWAHANSSHGVLSDMSGQQRILAIQCPFVTAAEGTDFDDEQKKSNHKRVIDLLDGTDPAYQRKLAVYQASDNPSGTPSGGHGLAGIGSRYAYFKLDQINLEGLRQCFADPDVRIRQSGELTISQYPRIKGVKITGGFLDKAETIFHEGLNSVLGAKGAGKSLLVEFMRFALDQQPTHPEILADHQDKLQARLEDYGRVEVLFSDETGKDCRIVRVFDTAEGNPYEDTAHPALAAAFPVLFLSQNEIIKIAEDPEQQIGFIDRFFDFRAYQNDIARAEQELTEQDKTFADSARAFLEVKGVKSNIKTREDEVRRLDETLKNPVFDEYQQIEAIDRLFREQERYLKAAEAEVTAENQRQGTAAIPSAPPALANDPRVRRILEIGKRAKERLAEQLDDAIENVKKAEAALTAERATWMPQLQAAKKKYEEAVQREGGDYRAIAQKRARALKELETLNAKAARLAGLSDRMRDVYKARQAAVQALKKVYAQYTQERVERCAAIEGETAGRLRIRIASASNVDGFRRRLIELKRGSHFREADIDRLSEKIDPGEFSIALIRFALTGSSDKLEEISRASGIDLPRVQVLAEFLVSAHSYENLLALEYKAVPQDRPEITYDVGGGRFEPLRRLSVGQKCTALLMIAMTDGRMPIVIDQPEDSLDIRSIWDDICLKLRRGKERRQFIFTTHNSSLAVASDSDKFIIMEGSADQGRIVFSGSMDHEPVSEEVIKYLEGGPATYRSKYGKYRGDRIVN
ncbi:MAG TPA: PHP domain-containing protein [Thermoanaerobaculia bacterium]|nr:PHP domain-containing protein [Thermoanaerobaculia bacterium]